MTQNRKFGRNYRLLVQREDDEDRDIIIEPPFSVEFSITRTSYAGANSATFKIYNLGQEARTQLRRNNADWGYLKKIVFLMGYGNELSVAFAGNIIHGYSVREGVDITTNLDCQDGGFAILNATTDRSYNEGTPNRNIINDIVQSLREWGVSPGAIGNFTGQNRRGSSYTGSAADILTSLTGGGFFIDAGKAYCIQQNEAIPGETIRIDATSGLIGTPTRYNTKSSFEMLLDPRLFIAQLIDLDSTVFPEVNGLHKVISIEHSGMISESIAGKATTKVTAEAGDFLKV